MLALLAVAPFFGLAFLSFGRISEANRITENLNQVQAATDELTEIVELQAAVQDENFWLATSIGVQALGFPPALVASTLGIDPAEQLENTMARTDRLVDAVQIRGLREEIAAARATSIGRVGVSGPLDTVETDIVEGVLLDKIERVIALAAEQPDGSQLVVLARKLQGANEARSSFSDLRAAFFANLDDLDADARQATLLELSKRLVLYERALENLDLLIASDSQLAGPFETVLAGEDRLEMIIAIEVRLADFGYATGEIELPAPEARPGAVSAALNFVRADSATVKHFDLVDTTADVLTAAVEEQRQAAQRSAMVVLAAALGIAMVSIGAVIAATRWIVRPLSDLGRTALALTLGGSGPPRQASGPQEIRLIHDALTEAITNLERTEQQAIALADGALDDPSLSQVVPGRFGATLNAAIEQLRRSISNQERSSDQLAYEAGHDGLTGLANRRATIDFLTGALNQSDRSNGTPSPTQTTVFFIDLDHFKQVNDVRGHAAGDEVLCAVADALRVHSRRSDLVGRIGGDEFLVVSDDPITVEDAEVMGERFLSAIKQSLDHERGEIGASIGVAMGQRGEVADTLLAEADIAMLEAKKQGRDSVRFFDDELRARTMDELTLSSNIKAGLQVDEFKLHYQPIVDALSGKVSEYEALIRWDRPGVGRVSPDDYIEFAERTDLVITIDRWVLNEAAKTLASNALDGIGIAVNISGRHLATGDLFGDLSEVLARTGVDPHLLTVEITESALLGDVDGAIETLRKVREIGVKVAIDDFGTGFTSLTHLRSLPADVLKIDQSFTSNLDKSDDANLVRLVIQTAHILRLDVVVEGVETVQQAERITMLGADQMQGYYFAKPMALADIVAAREQENTDLTTTRTSSHR